MEDFVLATREVLRYLQNVKNPLEYPSSWIRRVTKTAVNKKFIKSAQTYIFEENKIIKIM